MRSNEPDGDGRAATHLVRDSGVVKVERRSRRRRRRSRSSRCGRRGAGRPAPSRRGPRGWTTRVAAHGGHSEHTCHSHRNGTEAGRRKCVESPFRCDRLSPRSRSSGPLRVLVVDCEPFDHALPNTPKHTQNRHPWSSHQRAHPSLPHITHSRFIALVPILTFILIGVAGDRGVACPRLARPRGAAWRVAEGPVRSSASCGRGRGRARRARPSPA